MNEQMFGILAEFAGADGLLAATRAASAAGYRRLDAYSPIPIDGLAEAIDCGGRVRVSLWVLLAGIVGAVLGYGMQYYSTVLDYSLNLGGRPYDAWPLFIPVTIEFSILFGALAAFIGMLARNRLPQLHHPMFDVPGFEGVTRDRFFLCIEAADDVFEPSRVRAFFADQKPIRVTDVPVHDE